MSFIRTIGKGAGTVGGGLIGGTVKVAGKAVGSKWKDTGEWIEEVGNGIQAASEVAFENAGQFLDGAVHGAYGAIKQDEYHKQKGLMDLKDSTFKTIKGIGSTVKYTAQNVGTVYKGYSSGDKDQAIKGMKNLGKVVAVSGLAIGILDFADGADVAEAEELVTRNDHLNGYEHPETGVLFVEKTVDLPNGQVIEGTFPVFDDSFNVIIAEEIYSESDNVHFRIANATLYQAIVENPQLAYEMNLSQSDIQSLASGQTPEGYTWHHNEEPGLLQLVDEETHAQTAHTGGRSIWGGGSENR
ncbi:HNH endonuclease [Mesobacillus boroniphilus]|uniref:HNH endonuclease n=1 Tax=Mesobacillus boroniphilus TaxID=308892 RepID=A0A944GX67_9BACI|nr:HNH endonuclease [Mesobacillus boroniphilus]MBS8265688.1 HNH endonuclease [Mesobacillus boroniphilus]